MWPVDSDTCIDPVAEREMDARLPPEIKELASQGERFFSTSGLDAEAHCRIRGRRLCSMDELQAWNQCVLASGVPDGADLTLGCFRPFTWRVDGPPDVLAGWCEVVADFRPVLDARGREQMVRSIAAYELDARGYPQMFRVANDDVWCGGGNVEVRCCLDL
ncbi:MAG: hypothetical protein R3F60_24820 [bacterium]